MVRDSSAGRARRARCTIPSSELHDLLHHGFYHVPAETRHPKSGNRTKLLIAEGVTVQHKRLLADFRCRTRLVPGMLETRTTLRHICFWTPIGYGTRRVMTLTLAERHGYLAIRVSRYRGNDPYLAAGASEPTEKQWIGAEMPSIEAHADDVFGRDVPAYGLRRLILPRDPLASSLAFSVQIRLVLATILGFRMCEDCPHCVDSDKPCIDAFGSCAEAMGRVAGRCDSIPGAVE